MGLFGESSRTKQFPFQTDSVPFSFKFMVSELKKQYDEQGFVVVPNLVPPELKIQLEAACDRVISLTRSGSWAHRRTVGKQFPPFDNDNPDSWGVQHLMHPDLGEPIFSDWYTSDPLLRTICDLMECEDDRLQMELFNLLINPESHEFALRWHRDDIRETASEDEERQGLSIWNHGIQWNTALYKDSCLYIVPGSHKRPRTSEQRAHSNTMDPPKNPLDMPGSIQVTLNPGETVFYNSNILHCATYNPNARRATLHACIGDTSGGSSRARNVLQHGLEWMKDDRFKAGLNGKAKAMLDRLIKMQEAANGNIVYSQVG